MKWHEFIGFVLVTIGCLIAPPIYATNSVWDIVIPEFHLSNAPLSEAVASLENTSRRLDPKGRGIRIVYHKWPGQTGGEITFNATNILLHEAVRIVGSVCIGAPSDLYLVDDVALFCERQTEGPPIWHIAGISGRISDALTDAPVTNPCLITGDIFRTTNKISMATNGCFIATVQYQVRRPNLYGIRLSVAADDFVPLIFGAPGYMNTQTNVALGDLTWEGIIPHLEIRLERSK